MREEMGDVESAIYKMQEKTNKKNITREGNNLGDC